jgi:hypothetical protein
VNERIATAAENYDVERAEFFCECPDPACGERVVVSLDEYERGATRARASSMRSSTWSRSSSASSHAGRGTQSSRSSGAG